MKTGRNEPCPCGSGKKYKHCCGGNVIPFSAQPYDSGSKRIPDELRKQVYASIGVSGEAELGKVMKEYEAFCESLPEGADGPTFMEFRGIGNAATESIKRTQAEAGGKTFGSMEEIQEFARRQMIVQNNEPMDDFLGLSPAQMHDILNNPFSRNGHMVRIKKDVANDILHTAPVMKYALEIMRATAAEPEGLKATQTGCFNRKYVQAFFDKFIRDDKFNDRAPMKEQDVMELEEMRCLLSGCGYIRKRKDFFLLTKKGREVIDTGETGGMYADLFTQHIETFNWLYFSRFIDLHGFIQRAAVFLLYILKEKGSVFIPQQEFAALFLNAFPHYRTDVDKYSSYLDDDFFTNVLFFERFCVLFGLTESREQPVQEDRIFTKSDYKRSRLFEEIFDWKI